MPSSTPHLPVPLESSLGWKRVSPVEDDERSKQVRYLEQFTPQQRTEAITGALYNAKVALGHAIKASDVSWLKDCKAKAATLQAIAQQIGLGKEIQLDAIEFTRRAERALGVAIREGQARGEILRRGQVGPGRANQHGTVEDHSDSRIFSRPTDFATGAELSGVGNQGGIYAMTDDVSDEQFDEAIIEARTEGNLSRANVARKAKAKAQEPEPELEPDEPSKPVKKTAQGRRVMEHLSINLNSLANTLIKDIDPREIDYPQHESDVREMQSDLNTIKAFLKRVKEQ
jgi:hypothetical protein